jgi:hypothetical protein
MTEQKYSMNSEVDLSVVPTDHRENLMLLGPIVLDKPV